jgi:hypothetical protein
VQQIPGGTVGEFFERLRQRKLMPWALACVAGAFAPLQGVDIAAPKAPSP